MGCNEPTGCGSMRCGDRMWCRDPRGLRQPRGLQRPHGPATPGAAAPHGLWAAEVLRAPALASSDTLRRGDPVGVGDPDDAVLSGDKRVSALRRSHVIGVAGSWGGRVAKASVHTASHDSSNALLRRPWGRCWIYATLRPRRTLVGMRLAAPLGRLSSQPLFRTGNTAGVHVWSML